jgi:hypothetical protein
MRPVQRELVERGPLNTDKLQELSKAATGPLNYNDKRTIPQVEYNSLYMNRTTPLEC